MADEHNNIPENNGGAKPRGFSSKKNVIFIILVAVLTFGIGSAVIVAGVSNTQENRLSRYMRAAERYLSEMDYERAVIEYQRVLEIDPMNVDAILGLADAYMGLDDIDKALETLRDGLERMDDERIREKLDELTKPEESTVSSETEEPSSEPKETEEPPVSSELEEPSSEPEKNPDPSDPNPDPNTSEEREQKANVRGIQAEFVTPNGPFIYDVKDDTDSIDVYVKVTDRLGNPLANTRVDFTKDTTDDQVVFSASSAVTDANGIAKITMTQAVNTTNVRTTVSAKVAGLSDGFVQVYRWVQPEDADLLNLNTGRDDDGNYVTAYDNKTGVITLTFTDGIVETSLQKEMIAAVFVGSTGTTQFNIKNVVVNYNVVSITVEPMVGFDAGGLVSVTVIPRTIDGITYIMSSTSGIQYNPGVFEIEVGPN